MNAPRLPGHRAGAALSFVLVLLGVLGMAACTSGSSSSSAAPGTREVTAVLTAHARAVVHRDRAGFLAGVSTAHASAAFRARQSRQFANLAGVPLAGWSYRIVRRTNDRGAERTAARRYGSAAAIFDVEIRYALRGIDSRPTQHDLWWTFVRRDGKVVLAGDDDLADAGGTSWQAPWDFEPLVAERAAGTLVLAPPAAHATAVAVARVVAAAIPAVSSVWGSGWSRRVAVLLPSSADELAADTDNPGAGGSGLGSGDVSTAAQAVTDGTDPVSGAVYGQRLVIDPGAFGRLSTVGRQIVIRHEITHIATGAVTSDLAPRWVVEGFADYVGNLHSGQSVGTTASELRADVAHGRVPAALPDETTFDTPSTAPQAYEQAWLACRLIAGRAGQAGLVRFYRLAAADNPTDPTDPAAGALRSVLHESSAAFVAQWRAYLRAQLR